MEVHRRSLRLSRFLDRGLVPCSSAGSGLSDSDARQIRAELDAKEAVIVTLEAGSSLPTAKAHRAGPSIAWLKVKNRAHPSIARVTDAIEFGRFRRR